MTTDIDQDITRRIVFSRGADTYDNAPRQLVVDNFDDFEAAVLADRSQRNGQTFICAPLGRGLHCEKPAKYPGTNHWRLRDLVQPRLFLAFDFDGFADAAAFTSTLAYLARFRGFGYTTASHTPQAPRARAILSLLPWQSSSNVCLASIGTGHTLSMSGNHCAALGGSASGCGGAAPAGNAFGCRVEAGAKARHA